MNEPRHIGRSIEAVLAGFLAVVVLSLAVDVVLHAAGVFQPWGQPTGSGPLLLATAYRAVFGIAGGYIAARLAPGRPMKHAMALGVVGLVVSIASCLATGNADFGPHWYPIALVVLSMSQAWLGGKLREVQLRARAEGIPPAAGSRAM